MTTATFLRTPSALAEPKGAAHVRGSPDKTTLVLFTIEGARNPSHTYEATFDYQAVVTPGGYGAPILVDNATVRSDAIVGEMTNTTQETFSQLTATSMCFDADGRWGTVSEAAQVFGVSVDTIRRRMKRGELDTRREQTPQGFRWLIHLPDDADEESPQDAPRAPPAGDPHAQGSVVVYGPDPLDALIETLQRELDLRNREVARLHEVVGRQAMAIETATAAIPAKTTRQDAPESMEGTTSGIRPCRSLSVAGATLGLLGLVAWSLGVVAIGIEQHARHLHDAHHLIIRDARSQHRADKRARHRSGACRNSSRNSSSVGRLRMPISTVMSP